MKKQGHPEYRQVLFVDTATGFKLLCGSTATSDQEEMYEGKKVPVITVPISSSSHPFFVGGKQFVDTEGRVEKFGKYKRFVEQKQKASAPKEETAADEKPAKKAVKAKSSKK